MSAFYDIWISSSHIAPCYHRRENRDWKLAYSNVWLSLPDTDKGFITHITSDNYRLVLIGQLYEAISNQEILQRCITYIEQPEKGYNDPAGHFIIFVLDDTTKQTHVFTNRLGSYHAYWSADKAISTCYLSLAKAKADKKLDWQGVTGFMAMGYFPEDKTYLEGISIFEPASHYCFDEQLNLIENKKYWQWAYEPEQDRAELYAEQLHDILQSSLKVAVRDKNSVIPLSGGLDSRLLAGELTSKGLPYKNLQALSYGFTENSPEIKIAKQIAAQRNIPIDAYQMPDYLFDKLGGITEAVELFQYVDGTRQASATGWLSDNADVVIGGHWGDVWMNNMRVERKKELPAAFQKKIIKKGAAWLLENICESELKDGRGYLNDYFNSFINKYNNIQDADFVMKIYKTDQWSFRWTAASLRMYQSASFPVLPFYDKRIIDLFSTIPTEMVRDRKFQVSYLKQYHNDLAKITWQEYDADLYSYKYFNNRNIGYRVIDKIKRTMAAEKTIQRNWEVFYLNSGGQQNLENILLNNKLLNDIVAEPKVKQLLDDLYNNPSAANGYAVSMLLTFALFLKEVYEK